ncbi:MAG: hypothetical protein PHR83_04980 [Paludibacter sp.]|nr:hypothetical protein [Paludibacter sp.]
MKKGSKKIVLLVGLLAVAIASNAQDRLFTYTYQSGVLNKGQREIEVWNTFRTGKADYFSALDNRTEFEIGLGKNLQTAFYLNLSSATNTVSLLGIKSLETQNEISFSNEWKYKLLDPVANPIGLALYGEYGISGKEYELEGKVIVDKKMGAVTLAANAIYEMELEPGYKGNEFELEAEEHKADLNISAAYALNPRFNLTVESAFRNVIVEGQLEHSALYAGLGVSYSKDKFLLNFTVMPQLTSFKGATNSTLNLNEFEKTQCRLLFSYAL